MADIEKVIKGIECCRNGFCFACPYNDGVDDNVDCKQKWADDAISILKANKPRVLTLDEVNQDYKTWCLGEQEFEIWWLETKKAKKTIPASTMFMNDNEGVVLRTYFGEMKYFYAAYNKYWRCWSARPTDEQREGTPWT